MISALSCKRTTDSSMVEIRPSTSRRARGTLIGLIAGLALLQAAFGTLPTRALADNGPMGVTRTMVEQALQILRDKQMPIVERRRQLRAALEPRMDFNEMSRSALGYHWRSLSPQQRTDFSSLFTAFIEDAYLSKIQDYSGQQVDYLKANPIGAGYSRVDTVITQRGKQPLKVAYLLENKGGEWLVYDVTVDNISIVANYRNQFNRVINDQGFDKLMADLRAKQRELATLVGDAR
jgi:phospholipid transport system substrate-binding protein